MNKDYHKESSGVRRTHSSRHVVEEQFAEHLPVRTPEDVAERPPRRRLVRVKYRLERDAETDDEHAEHEQELDQLSYLQQHARTPGKSNHLR